MSASRVDQRRMSTMTITEMDRIIEADLLSGEVTLLRRAAAGGSGRERTMVEVPELVTRRPPLETQFDRFLDIVTGISDASAERRTILPVHHVMAQVLAGAREPVVGDRCESTLFPCRSHCDRQCS